MIKTDCNSYSIAIRCKLLCELNKTEERIITNNEKLLKTVNKV